MEGVYPVKGRVYAILVAFGAVALAALNATGPWGP
jgi:hypothetical protein